MDKQTEVTNQIELLRDELPEVADNEPPTPNERQTSNKNTSSFAALHHNDFRLLAGGQLISVIGSRMQVVAIDWHIYLLTKSAFALGMVGLVRVVPIVVCSLFGGVVADAFNRKKTFAHRANGDACVRGIIVILDDERQYHGLVDLSFDRDFIGGISCLIAVAFTAFKAREGGVLICAALFEIQFT